MYDLIIIGGGPAGLTAALYAGRARLKTLLLEKVVLGGQIMLTPNIDNFPGFRGGVPTEELILQMHKQAQDLDIEIKTDEVTQIICNGGFKIYAVEGGYQAKSIILASGAFPKKLDIPGEDIFLSKGVSYCATCDGPLFKGKEIFVIGGGDKAVEEALYLTKYAKEVTLIHRRDTLRASKILQEKVFQNKKIKVLWSTQAQEIIGARSVEALKIKNLKTGEIKNIKTCGVFIFVGIRPNTSYLGNLVKLDEQGFILTGEDMATSCEGIFAAGDCRKKILNQVITACSDGAVAAISVNRYLETKTY